MAKTDENTTLVGRLGDWRRMLEPLKANAADLAHLEGSRTKLETLLAQAVQLQKEQALATATRQETTRQLVELTAEGRRVASLLRLGVKEHYGPRAEKLAEFGLQPFRGRAAAAAKKKGTPAATPSAPTPSTATPSTAPPSTAPHTSPPATTSTDPSH